MRFNIDRWFDTLCGESFTRVFSFGETYPFRDFYFKWPAKRVGFLNIELNSEGFFGCSNRLIKANDWAGVDVRDFLKARPSQGATSLLTRIIKIQI